MSKHRFQEATSHVDQGSTMGSSNLDPKSRVRLAAKPSKRQLLVERELGGKAEHAARRKVTLPKINAIKERP